MLQNTETECESNVVHNPKRMVDILRKSYDISIHQ